MHSLIVAVGLLACLNAASAEDCRASFTTCQPPDAAGTALPPVGGEMAPLYGHFLDSIRGVHFKRDAPIHASLFARDRPSICCAENTNCLNLQQLNIPFCYDRFTTNFVLADGTSGSLDDGELNLNGGGHVNLQNGSFTTGDSSGDIYAASPPDFDSQLIPTPYTSAGVGSAIPVSGLAGLVTLTSVIPATTIAPTTVPATTVDVTFTLESGDNAFGSFTFEASSPLTTTVASTQAATTLPATTIDAVTVVTIVTVSGDRSTQTGTEGMDGTGGPSSDLAPRPTGAAGAVFVGLAAAFVAAF